jgi:hypothetical protein
MSRYAIKEEKGGVAAQQGLILAFLIADQALFHNIRVEVYLFILVAEFAHHRFILRACGHNSFKLIRKGKEFGVCDAACVTFRIEGKVEDVAFYQILEIV